METEKILANSVKHEMRLIWAGFPPPFFFSSVRFCSFSCKQRRGGGGGEVDLYDKRLIREDFIQVEKDRAGQGGGSSSSSSVSSALGKRRARTRLLLYTFSIMYAWKVEIYLGTLWLFRLVTHLSYNLSWYNGFYALYLEEIGGPFILTLGTLEKQVSKRRKRRVSGGSGGNGLVEMHSKLQQALFSTLQSGSTSSKIHLQFRNNSVTLESTRKINHDDAAMQELAHYFIHPRVPRLQ